MKGVEGWEVPLCAEEAVFVGTRRPVSRELEPSFSWSGEDEYSMPFDS